MDYAFILAVFVSEWLVLLWRVKPARWDRWPFMALSTVFPDPAFF